MAITSKADIQEFLRETIGRSEFLSYDNLASAFGIARQTLYNDRSSGALMPMNPNGHTPRFSLDAIYRYLLQKQLIA
jgi:hypothetical protein